MRRLFEMFGIGLVVGLMVFGLVNAADYDIGDDLVWGPPGESAGSAIQKLEGRDETLLGYINNTKDFSAGAVAPSNPNDGEFWFDTNTNDLKQWHTSTWNHIVYIGGGTDVAVVDGGTGSSTPAAARSTLGLEIDVDVEASGNVATHAGSSSAHHVAGSGGSGPDFTSDLSITKDAPRIVFDDSVGGTDDWDIYVDSGGLFFGNKADGISTIDAGMLFTVGGSGGELAIGTDANGPAKISLDEDFTNGSNYVSIVAPSSIVGADKVQTLQDATGTLPLLVPDANGNGLNIAGLTTLPGYVRLYERSDQGTQSIILIAPFQIDSNRTATFPDATGTVAYESTYGEIYGASVGAHTLSTNYTIVTGLSDGLSSNTTISGANGTIDADEAGIYQVTTTMNFTMSATENITCAIHAEGVEQTDMSYSEALSSGNYQISLTGLLSLAINDTVTLQCKGNASGDTITPLSINISLVEIN